MMLRSLLALFVLLLSALSAAAADDVPAAQPSAAACALAETYLLSIPVVSNGGSIVFSDNDLGVPTDEEGFDLQDLKSNDQISKTVSVKLISALRANGAINAVKICANVRNFLDNRKISYGSDAINFILSTEGMNFKIPIFSMSVPVISDDGKDALLAESYSAGRLSGMGKITHLRRQLDNTWKAFGFWVIWVS
jgi:opacity protein-like surface antigen